MNYPEKGGGETMYPKKGSREYNDELWATFATPRTEPSYDIPPYESSKAAYGGIYVRTPDGGRRRIWPKLEVLGGKVVEIY